VPNVQWKIPDDGQRNCPKHLEFLDKNKFGKLVRLLVLLKRKDSHSYQRLSVLSHIPKLTRPVTVPGETAYKFSKPKFSFSFL
jgi:hypothetical protein